MIHVGVYEAPKSKPHVDAAFEGLRAAGYAPTWRNGHHYREGQVEPFDLVFLFGLRGQRRLIRNDYAARGVRAFVLDLGYLARANTSHEWREGYFQLGLDRLNWIPPFDCPPDRFKALRCPLKKWGERGEAVYIFGQKEDDASHGMTGYQVLSWFEQVTRYLRTKTDRRIVWRPHPFSDMDYSHAPALSDGPMDWPDAHSVYLVNSNGGLEALIEGVPVVCRKDAPYADLCAREWSETLKRPTRTKLTKYLQRVAYAQWSTAELKSGEPFRWLNEKGLIP